MQSPVKEESNYEKHEDEISVESLLSDLSDDEADVKPPKRRGLARRKQLEKKFALRDKVLERLRQGKSDSYFEMLRHHEEIVRAETLRTLEQNGCNVRKPVTEDKNNEKESANSAIVENTIEDCIRPGRQCSLFERIILFEKGLVFPTFIVMLLYCSAHMASYEVIYTLSGEISKALGVTQHSVFAGSIILSFVLFRANGGLWDWCSKSTHGIAKFELHNRLHLGYWDAKLHLWFRKRQTLKQFLTFIAFYLCFIGMEDIFRNTLLIPLTSDRSWILSKLPSKPYGVDTIMSLWLNEVLTGECENNLSEIELEECLFFEKLTKEDDNTLQKVLSLNSYEKFFGDEKALAAPIFVVFFINAGMALVSFFILYYKLNCRVYD